MFTGGSTSVKDAWQPMREAGSVARADAPGRMVGLEAAADPALRKALSNPYALIPREQAPKTRQPSLSIPCYAERRYGGVLVGRTVRSLPVFRSRRRIA